MSSHSSNKQLPGMTDVAKAVSGTSARAQQALLTTLFSTAQIQFAFASGLIDDIGEVLRTLASGGNQTEPIQALISRFHGRAEQTISDLHRVSDDLRDNWFELTTHQTVETHPHSAEKSLPGLDEYHLSEVRPTEEKVD